MNSTTLPLAPKDHLPNTQNQALCQEGLFVELLPAETASAQVQLFPDGLFSAKDGRPANLNGEAQTWQINAPIAHQLIKLWKLRKSQLCIDYEHQTIFSQQNGQPAPAAGWIKALNYIPNQGLFAKVYWTPQARNYIKNLEYRYISPTFHFDPNTGAILELVGAGLTNDPGLDGLNAIMAKNNLTLGDLMNPSLLAQIRTKLQLPPNLTDADLQAICLEFSQLNATPSNPLQPKLAPEGHQIMANQSPANQNSANQNMLNQNMANQNSANQNMANQNMLNQNAANQNINNQPNNPSQAGFVPDSVTQTYLQPNNVNQKDIQPNFEVSDSLPTKQPALPQLEMLLSKCASLEAQMVQLQTRLAVLEQSSSDLINTALHEGKLLKNQEPWARELQQSNPEMLRRYLSTSQPLQALRSMQTKHQPPATSALTDTEQAICRMCGLTEAEFIAAKSQGV